MIDESLLGTLGREFDKTPEMEMTKVKDIQVALNSP
jgi:hypothetical protein